jgi:hypothetical protein
MSAKFKEMGGQVYLDADKVKESNRVLWGDNSSTAIALPRRGDIMKEARHHRAFVMPYKGGFAPDPWAQSQLLL